MTITRRFNAPEVRDALLKRGGPTESGFVRHAYRPFDTRWLYWEADTKLLDEKRSEYRTHAFAGNLWLGSNKREIHNEFTHGTTTQHLGNWKLANWGIHFFPAWLREDALGTHGSGVERRSNLSPAARVYLDRLNLTVEDLFHHILAVLHDPAYREANAGALRMEWPRIRLLHWPELSAPTAPTSALAEQAAEILAASAARGRELAALLDPDTPVPGVTIGDLRPGFVTIAEPATIDGGQMAPADFALTAGWGHFGSGEAVVPGQGRAVERAYTPDDRAALGDTTFDIYLNDRAYWRNVPASVWHYKLGGYQVLKKWLSYRERKVLRRPLRLEEVQHFSATARRISAILLATASPTGRGDCCE